MKFLSLMYLLCLMTGTVISQNLKNTDVIGVFSQKINNPEGGETLIILPDNIYILIYFGGFQKGKWRLTGNTLLLERETEPIFALYARYIESLGNKIKLDFSVESNNQAAINFNPKIGDKFKPIFNVDANCLDYPYSIFQVTPLQHLQAAQIFNAEYQITSIPEIKAAVYEFKNLENYNDFILVNLPYEYTTPVIIETTYRNNTLYFEHGFVEMSKKSLESIDILELDELKKIASQDILPKILAYGNEFFPHMENPTEEDLTTFRRLEPFRISADKNISLEKEPLFTATCRQD